MVASGDSIANRTERESEIRNPSRSVLETLVLDEGMLQAGPDHPSWGTALARVIGRRDCAPEKGIGRLSAQGNLARPAS
jgi:hypothetical protein